MTKFDFPPSIASRPVYGILEPRTGSTHLMIADAEGAEAIIDLAKVDSAIFANAHIIYIPKSTGEKYVDQLQALNPLILYVGPSFGASIQRLRKVLEDNKVGLQLYLTGTEGLMDKRCMKHLKLVYHFLQFRLNTVEQSRVACNVFIAKELPKM